MEAVLAVDKMHQHQPLNPNLNPNLANTATLQPMDFRVRNHVMATNRLMRE